MADYPDIPFRDALSGPAGEYSDAYKNIVQKYRDEVDSAQQLRTFQQDQQYADAGLRPPSQVQARLAPALIHKSGNDIVRIDPLSGQANLIYRAPSASLRPAAIPQPRNPYVDPREMEIMRVARDTLKSAQTRFQKLSDDPNTESQTLMEAGLDLKDAQDRLDGFAPPAVPAAPPLNPQPGLQAPTSTATAPAYRPAPMMDANEVAPPGSIIMGRRNTLDAPPSTTQSTRKRWVYKDGQLVPAQ